MKQRGRPKTAGTLTDRELEVLRLIKKGRTNREIADELEISLAGVKFHVAEILSRLQVENREEAAKWEPGSALFLLPLFGWLKRHGLFCAASAVCAIATFAGLTLIVARPATGPAAIDLAVANLSTPLATSSAEDSRTFFYGDFVGIQGDVLTIRDPSSGVITSFTLLDRTLLTRPEGYQIVTDFDLSRLKAGDTIGVEQPVAGPNRLAKHIRANAVKVAEVLVSDATSGLLSGLINRGVPNSAAPSWAEQVQVRYSPDALDLSGRSLATYQPKERVMVHGYVADDGTILVE